MSKFSFTCVMIVFLFDLATHSWQDEGADGLDEELAQFMQSRRPKSNQNKFKGEYWKARKKDIEIHPDEAQSSFPPEAKITRCTKDGRWVVEMYNVQKSASWETRGSEIAALLILMRWAWSVYDAENPKKAAETTEPTECGSSLPAQPRTRGRGLKATATDSVSQQEEAGRKSRKTQPKAESNVASTAADLQTPALQEASASSTASRAAGGPRLQPPQHSQQRKDPASDEPFYLMDLAPTPKKRQRRASPKANLAPKAPSAKQPAPPPSKAQASTARPKAATPKAKQQATVKPSEPGDCSDSSSDSSTSSSSGH